MQAAEQGKLSAQAGWDKAIKDSKRSPKARDDDGGGGVEPDAAPPST